MKLLLTILGAILLVGVGRLAVKYGPWIPAGKALCQGDWRFADRAVQIWQVKNRGWAEGFATGVFIKAEDGEWRVFCLDHDEVHNPRIGVRHEGAFVYISIDGRFIGTLDLVKCTYRAANSSGNTNEGLIDGNPPGGWFGARFYGAAGSIQ